MAYIPRPLNTSPSTTMTIRQGGDLINDNFEELADSRNDIEGLQTNVGTLETNVSTLQTDVGTLETNVSTLQTDVGTLETNVSTLQTDKAPLADADFTNMPSVGGDPIVESGSNSDGEWTRWADGTQICHAKNSIPFDRADIHDFRFPQVFTDVLGGGILPRRGSHTGYNNAVVDTAYTSESDRWVVFVRTTSTVITNPARMFASGRWK